MTFPQAVIDYKYDNNCSFIKAWRVYLKKTQKEVAASLGITQGAYSQIENAESNQKSTLEKVSKALGLEIGQLTLVDWFWMYFSIFRGLRKNMVILSRNSAFAWLAPLTAIHKFSVSSTHSHDICMLVQSGAALGANSIQMPFIKLVVSSGAPPCCGLWLTHITQGWWLPASTVVRRRPPTASWCSSMQRKRVKPYLFLQHRKNAKKGYFMIPHYSQAPHQRQFAKIEKRKS